MVWSWADAWPHEGTTVFMALPGYVPAWQDDAQEVRSKKEPTSSCVLDLQGVEMQVELRGYVAIEGGVNILEVDPLGVLVKTIWKGVWLVEAASHGSGLGLDEGPLSEGRSKEQRIHF